MVYNFRVFKKQSPNAKLTLYLGKRDFVDHISGVEPVGKYLHGAQMYKT
jgi:arrestin-1